MATFVPTPGGLGTVETLLIALLTSFDTRNVVTSVLVYRVINFWLPIPFGTAAYLTLRRSGRPEAVAAGAEAVPATVEAVPAEAEAEPEGVAAGAEAVPPEAGAVPAPVEAVSQAASAEAEAREE